MKNLTKKLFAKVDKDKYFGYKILFVLAVGGTVTIFANLPAGLLAGLFVGLTFVLANIVKKND